MLASELIKALQEKIEKDGDAPIKFAVRDAIAGNVNNAVVKPVGHGNHIIEGKGVFNINIKLVDERAKVYLPRQKKMKFTA
jgi:hypothetical protein